MKLQCFIKPFISHFQFETLWSFDSDPFPLLTESLTCRFVANLRPHLVPHCFIFNSSVTLWLCLSSFRAALVPRPPSYNSLWLDIHLPAPAWHLGPIQIPSPWTACPWQPLLRELPPFSPPNHTAWFVFFWLHLSFSASCSNVYVLPSHART